MPSRAGAPRRARLVTNAAITRAERAGGTCARRATQNHRGKSAVRARSCGLAGRLDAGLAESGHAAHHPSIAIRGFVARFRQGIYEGARQRWRAGARRAADVRGGARAAVAPHRSGIAGQPAVRHRTRGAALRRVEAVRIAASVTRPVTLGRALRSPRILGREAIVAASRKPPEREAGAESDDDCGAEAHPLSIPPGARRIASFG